MQITLTSHASQIVLSVCSCRNHDYRQLASLVGTVAISTYEY